MELAEILSNNEIVHASFALSWVCLFLAGLLMFFTREEGRAGNTVLTLLLPVDILAGTAFAYIGSGSIDTAWSQVICIIILAFSAAVIVCGLLWHSSTSVGLAAIGLEFAVISLRFFGGYTALIMSAYIVLIAFMHGLRKYRDHRERQAASDSRTRRQTASDSRARRQTASRRNGYERSRVEPRYSEDSEGALYSTRSLPQKSLPSSPAEQPEWMDDFRDLRRPYRPQQQQPSGQNRPRRSREGFPYEEAGFSYDQEGFLYEQRQTSVRRNPPYNREEDLYGDSDYYDDF